MLGEWPVERCQPHGRCQFSVLPGPAGAYPLDLQPDLSQVGANVRLVPAITMRDFWSSNLVDQTHLTTPVPVRDKDDKSGIGNRI